MLMILFSRLWYESGDLLRRIVASMVKEFAMKDLGVLHHFLGVTVEYEPWKIISSPPKWTNSVALDSRYPRASGDDVDE
ncbi:hypothetical protein U9M48_044370 [Paspalum notatum var. saurae]|uniref:Reverse transcriptase Ty1/copia-type domain-containing protein n=1 Tax=Paspalum notatum var. saurae TaxID=547442 RepID=A0AAQ3UZ04_PASNO